MLSASVPGCPAENFSSGALLPLLSAAFHEAAFVMVSSAGLNSSGMTSLFSVRSSALTGAVGTPAIRTPPPSSSEHPRPSAAAALDLAQQPALDDLDDLVRVEQFRRARRRARGLARRVDRPADGVAHAAGGVAHAAGGIAHRRR